MPQRDSFLKRARSLDPGERWFCSGKLHLYLNLLFSDSVVFIAPHPWVTQTVSWKFNNIPNGFLLLKFHFPGIAPRREGDVQSRTREPVNQQHASLSRILILLLTHSPRTRPARHVSGGLGAWLCFSFCLPPPLLLFTSNKRGSESKFLCPHPLSAMLQL